jgi:hypothetical protein
MNRTILVGLFSLIAVGISSAASPDNEPILIKATRLIDMSKGSISHDQAILINRATLLLSSYSGLTSIRIWRRTRATAAVVNAHLSDPAVACRATNLKDAEFMQ